VFYISISFVCYQFFVSNFYIKKREICVFFLPKIKMKIGFKIFKNNDHLVSLLVFFAFCFLK